MANPRSGALSLLETSSKELGLQTEIARSSDATRLLDMHASEEHALWLLGSKFASVDPARPATPPAYWEVQVGRTATTAKSVDLFHAASTGAEALGQLCPLPGLGKLGTKQDAYAD